MIEIGAYLPDRSKSGQINAIDDAIATYKDLPWMKREVSDQVGIEVSSSSSSTFVPAVILRDTIAHHGIFAGGSGGGKTHAKAILGAGLITNFYSVVGIDAKGDLPYALAVAGFRAGLPPSRLTIVDPGVPNGMPGINAFAVDGDVAQIAQDFVDAVEGIRDGARMADLAINCALVMAAYHLSLLEFIEFLSRPTYRQALLAQPPPCPISIAVRIAISFWQSEFAFWSPSEQSSAIAAVVRKLREIVRNDHLRTAACAAGCIDFESLWQRPQVIVVKPDPARLGSEGARILTTWIVSGLLRAALRSAGRVPVALIVDELTLLGNAAAEQLMTISNVARSKGLSLFIGTQVLSQIDDRLRMSLLTNCGLKCFFRLGFQEAGMVASSLATGSDPKIVRATISPVIQRETGTIAWTSRQHLIHDETARPMAMSRTAWVEFHQLTSTIPDPVSRLRAYAHTHGGHRLYVKSADSGEFIELGQYVGPARTDDIRITGPKPLKLVTRYPKPKVSSVERTNDADDAHKLERMLLSLSVRHMLTTVMGGPPRVVRVKYLDLNEESFGFYRYIQASLRANGISQSQANETYDRRSAVVERLAALVPYEEKRRRRGST